MAKLPKLGSGKRFFNLKNKLIQGGHSASSAEAISAAIGMKKFGKKKMLSLAAKGRKK